MKDFILRNIERVFSLLLTGIFLALLYFGNEKGLHLWFDSGRESGSLGLVTGIFIFFSVRFYIFPCITKGFK